MHANALVISGQMSAASSWTSWCWFKDLKAVPAVRQNSGMDQPTVIQTSGSVWITGILVWMGGMDRPVTSGYGSGFYILTRKCVVPRRLGSECTTRLIRARSHRQRHVTQTAAPCDRVLHPQLHGHVHGKVILRWSHMTFHSAASDQFAQVVGASDLFGHVVVLCGESELQRDLGVPQPVPCWFATELMGSCGFTRAWKLNLELVGGKNDESMTSCISRKLWTIVCHGR